MALNRLQLRRDTIANFLAANRSTLGGELVYISDEQRLRVGKGGDSPLHRILSPLPDNEGIQFHSLWNCTGYGNEPYVTVPATNGETGYVGGSALDANNYAFSGSLPDFLLQDAAVAKIHVVGDYTTGSSDPAMLFKFEIGNDEGASVSFGPRRGAVQPEAVKQDGTATVAVTFYMTPDAGINVSSNVTGPNSLHYSETIRWELDATVMFMGWNASSGFETSQEGGTSDEDANVRIYGTLRWGEIVTSSYSGGTVPGPVFGGFTNSSHGAVSFSTVTWRNANTSWSAASVSYDTDNYVEHPAASGDVYRCYLANTSSAATEPGTGGSWEDNWAQVSGVATSYKGVASERGFPAGYRTSAHGLGYRAIGPIPTEAISDINIELTDPDDTSSGTLAVHSIAIDKRVDALIREWTLGNESAPGSGRLWQHYWQRVQNCMEFCFEENVDLRAVNQTLSLKVGGPMQNDRTTAFGAWASGTTYNASDPSVREADCVSASGVDYAPRFSHASSNSFAPGPDTANPDNEFGEWRRFWYPLSDDRRDVMRIHSSVAYLMGGSAGIADFVSL